MGRLLLCTPSQLWTLLLNRYRMTPKDFDPGTVSDVAHTGTGTGTVRITDLPYDAYTVELRVLRSGDSVAKIGPVTATVTGTGHIEVGGVPKNTYQVRVEIMAVGYFRYSLNGGTSYSVTIPIPSPSSPKYEIAGAGIHICFLPGNTGFAVGDLFVFSTVGPAQVQATVYNISNPIEATGTGTLSVSGQSAAGRPYTISVCVTGPGTIGEAQWVYSVNGGAPVGPAPLPSSFTIPCLDVTLTFDPGCGPTYFGCGSQWIISTRGSAIYDVSDKPVPLARPEQTGLRLNFEPQDAASPAFVAGDTYAFTTTGAPDLLEELYAASDEALAKLRARYMGQVILAWDRAVTINTGRIALATLYDRKGQNFKEDEQSIRKKSTEAHAFFTRVGSKLEHPLIVAMPLPGILAPSVRLGPDESGIGDGPFGSLETSFGGTIVVGRYGVY